MDANEKKETSGLSKENVLSLIGGAKIVNANGQTGWINDPWDYFYDTSGSGISCQAEEGVLYQCSDESAKGILSGKWYGKLDDKNLVIDIENVSGGTVTGYNIAGKNKRPLKGTYIFCRDGCGMASLVLKEPGDHKFDGKFNIEMEVFEDKWDGGGTWKSYDGKLNRKVFIAKMALDAASLLDAAQFGDVNRVRTLIDHGVDVNLQDEEGKTALDYAQENGHAEIVELLKKADAKE